MQRFRLVCGVKKWGKVAFLCAFPCFFTLVTHFFLFSEAKIIEVAEAFFLSSVDFHR